MKEWLSEQVWGGRLAEGGEGRRGGGGGGEKVSLGRSVRGEDERFTTAASLMKENLENKAVLHKKQQKKKQVHTMADRVLLVLLLFVCVCAPFRPYGGLNTMTYSGHLIQIRR